MNNKVLLFLLTMVFSFGTLYGQNALSKQQKIDALNSVVHFINESTHGTVIVHNMLENYNQEINNYVDAKSVEIFISNKFLQADIFGDKEYYSKHTPYEWYDIAVKQSKKHKYDRSQSIIAKMAKMKSILTQINQIRFDLEKKVMENDLSDTMALNNVYRGLQRGEKLYADYSKIQREILQQVALAYKPLVPNIAEVKYPKLYKAFTDVYKSSRDLLIAIKKKDDENIDNLIVKNKQALNRFENLDLTSFGTSILSSRKAQQFKKDIIRSGKDMIQSADRFQGTAEVPEEFKQHGKFYYYYKDMVMKFNYIGLGTSFQLNNFLDYIDVPVMIFAELPYYYKLIWPKKLEKVDHIVATDSKIVKLPEILKDRKIQMSTRTIKVDSLKFEVALYDHMIEDGDVISLNFNGDWIIEKMPLLVKPKKLKLKLNSEGKNYFILHAENVGRRPPNTMAVDYYYRGRKQQIILKSDLNVSEMIEIEYVN